jgi:hypothetical protein
VGVGVGVGLGVDVGVAVGVDVGDGVGVGTTGDAGGEDGCKPAHPTSRSAIKPMSERYQVFIRVLGL